MPRVQGKTTKAPIISANSTNDWQVFSNARLQEELAKGSHVFVDMTADWCITCKVNEKMVLDTDDIAKAFKEKNITLLKGDWTDHNQEIADFLKSYNRYGIPFYVLYSKDLEKPFVFPELISKNMVLEALSKIKK